MLSDQAQGDKKKIEEMRRSQVLQAEHFFTMADFLERPEADIEDIFEPALFAAILNGTYDPPEDRKLTAEKLAAAGGGTARLVKQAEAAFAVMPAEVADFDHFAPAAWLIRNPKVLDAKTGPVPKPLERAQRIFDTCTVYYKFDAGKNRASVIPHAVDTRRGRTVGMPPKPDASFGSL